MTYGSAHYWASEDLNTTGENVGITLDSMCDIIAANDVTNGNAVVFVPGDIEHGEKGHFALGEGGGGGANIDASAYQVVIGDGEGNGVGAQGGAEAQEANKIYLKNKRLGPNIPTHEDDGTPLVGADTGSFTIASNGLGHTHTETVHDDDLDEDVEVQVEDDGWKATIEDLAKVLATGKSKVEIGEFGKDYSANAKFWSEPLAGPDIKIKGAAKIEMLGKADASEDDQYAYGVPTVSMRGNCLIDMCDTISQGYLNGGQVYQADPQLARKSIFGEYTNYSHPNFTPIFASRNQPIQNAPILQMKGRAIISMVDEAFLQMTDSAYAVFEGNAYFKVNGGGYRSYATSSGGDEKTLFQHAEFNAGSVFILDGGGSADAKYGVIGIMNNQMMFSNAGRYSSSLTPGQIGPTGYNSVSSGAHGDVLYSVGYDWSRVSGFNPSYWPHATGAGAIGRYIDAFAIRKIGFEGDIGFTEFSNGITRDKKQTLLMDGTTRVKIGGQTDGSLTLVDIGGAAGSNALVAVKSGYHGSTFINYGADSYAAYFKNVHINSGAKVCVSLQADNGGDCTYSLNSGRNALIAINGTLAVESSSSRPYSLPQFGGKNCFGMNFDLYQTDIEAKWNRLQAIWEGYDHFIQIDGITHFENWGGKFLFRSEQGNIFSPSTGTCYPYYEIESLSPVTQEVAKSQYYIKNYNAPEPPSNTPTEAEIKAYYGSSVASTTPTAKWGYRYVLNNLTDITDNGESSSGYWYVKIILKNYAVKEGIYTFTFKDSTEYTTFEDLNAAIAAHPENMDWYGRNTREYIIGFKSGSMGNRVQVADGWQYTINAAVTYRQMVADNPWDPYGYQGKTYVLQNLWPVTAGMGYNDLPTVIKNSVSGNGSYSLRKWIANAGSTTAGVILSNLVYTDLEVVTAYVYEPHDISYNCNFVGEKEDSIDWFLPSVQQSAVAAGAYNQMFNHTPIVQMTGQVNVSIHGKFNTSIRTYNFESTETYDVSDQAQAIQDFVNGPDYADFLAVIEALTIKPYSHYKTYEAELWKFIEIKEGSAAGTYTVAYTIKPKDWHEHIDSTANNPVVEITDDSEIRLYDGAIVKGYRPDFGETTFEFKSSDSSEEPVSFTLSELKALKQLLTTSL